MPSGGAVPPDGPDHSATRRGRSAGYPRPKSATLGTTPDKSNPASPWQRAPAAVRLPHGSSTGCRANHPRQPRGCAGGGEGFLPVAGAAPPSSHFAMS
jgi:hypothetical protein